MSIINSKEEINRTPQSVYDAFNTFIFSNDTKVLSKLLFKLRFLDLTKDVCGDILEMGVFKGSGLLGWLKLKKIFYPNSFKKIIGFDIFNPEKLIKILDGYDREYMSKLFSSRKFLQNEDYINILIESILKSGFDLSDFELVQGDVSITTKDFAKERPGVKISILYMDLDLDKPTYDSLSNLWERISSGGYVVFDEYSYHQWSETNGADRFIKENKLVIHPLDCPSPTAFIKKE
jgi:hypothetical protein